MKNLLLRDGAVTTPPAQVAPAAPRAPTPEDFAQARQHMTAVMQGLLDLASRPQGSISKRDLYNAAGEMIAQGAFPTPEAKQQLVAQLAQMPDDEASIRKAIGQQLLQMGVAAEQLDVAFPEERPNG